MKLRSLFAAFALVLSSQAMAYTEDLGTIGAGGKDFSNGFIRFFGVGSPLGDFTDTYTFKIAADGLATGGTISFDLGFVDLKLNSVSLFQTGNPASAKIDSTPGSFTFTDLLANTSYTLAVNGSLYSSKWLDLGVAYYEGNIRSIASAAPEPGALALALAGLLGVGVLVRRRQAR